MLIKTLLNKVEEIQVLCLWEGAMGDSKWGRSVSSGDTPQGQCFTGMSGLPSTARSL